MLWWNMVRSDLKIVIKTKIVTQTIRNRMKIQSPVLFKAFFKNNIIHLILIQGA